MLSCFLKGLAFDFILKLSAKILAALPSLALIPFNSAFSNNCFPVPHPFSYFNFETSSFKGV